MLCPILQVALPRPLPTPLDYLPPPGARVDATWVGCRIRVPLGRSELIGVVSGLAQARSETPLKPAIARIDAAPLLSPEGEAWACLQFVARYYHAPFGEVWATALPATLRDGALPPEVRSLGWCLTRSGQAALYGLRAGKPKALAEILAGSGENGCPEARLDQEFPGWRTAARALAARGLAQAVPLATPARMIRSALRLNDAQQAALTAITGSGGFAPLLLDGITGSGKTEVYLEAIRHALVHGKQALLLVPEIGLTAQTVARLQRGLPVEVHALHSGLADGERSRAWAAMASGHGRVLVGTRSAVFVPLPDAGLIVVDEEHDASYKQQDGIRYHARDLALWRGRHLGVPVVLGSATPALETQRRAIAGRCQRLVLPGRARPAAKPPAVRTYSKPRSATSEGSCGS